MITKLVSNIFLCNCNTFHGVKNVRKVKDKRIVGECLKCGKRVFGTIMFDNKELQE